MPSSDIDTQIGQRNLLREALTETERELDLLDEKSERFAVVYAENGRLFDLVEDYNTAIFEAPTTSLSHLIEKISIALHWIEMGFEPADLMRALWNQLQSAPPAMA
jgi:hypothetical protein